jgi:pimeloyl-ACP methyl ester carboxylesterase
VIPADLDDIVTHRTVDAGGLRMHVVEAGAGPAVVLLHGFPEMWWSWRHQIRPLAEAGFRVIVPDQRGYNDTDKQGPYDLDTLAGDICRLVEAVDAGPKVRLVGHDWGGAVTWHLASTRPEIVERAAVLNCPHPVMMKKGFTKLSQLKRSWYMFAFQLPGLAERYITRDGNLLRMLRANAVDRTNTGDDELEPFVENIQKPGALTAMLGWYRAMPGFALSKQRRKLGKISAETMLLWGMRDSALGYDDLVPGTERFAPNLKIVPVEEAGHFVQSDRPVPVNQALIDFLT